MGGARLIRERYSSFLLLPTPADAAPAPHPFTRLLPQIVVRLIEPILPWRAEDIYV